MSREQSEAVQKMYSCLNEEIERTLVPPIAQKRFLSNNRSDKTNGAFEISVDSVDFSNPDVQLLYMDACNRLANQEIRKQNNISNVIRKVEKLLQKEKHVSKEKVDQDWVTRFINSVGDVSEETMQKIWSSILATEIMQPNSFSLRTLDAVTKMSAYEARLFEKTCQFIVNIRGSLVVINNEEINKKYGLSYEDVLLLGECGLLEDNPMMSLEMEVSKNLPFQLLYADLIVLSKCEDNRKMRVPVYKITSTGFQLFGIIKPTTNLNYLREIESFIAEKNEGIVFSEHEILEKLDNGQIRYNVTGREIL